MLDVQLLGPVRAWSRGKELDLGSTQQRSLFALLASVNGQYVGRSEIVDTLWPAGPPAAATNVVQTYVKRLRRALEPERPPRAPSSLLPSAGEGYRLATDKLDLAVFRDLVHRARRSEVLGERVELLAMATGMWHGTPFATTALADSAAAYALLTERDRALCWYADAALAAGRAAEAAPALEEAAGTAPMNEALHAALMRLQQATGRRSAAFETFFGIRTRLLEDLGVDPGPELTAAHTDLLAHDGPAAIGSVGQEKQEEASELFDVRARDRLLSALRVIREEQAATYELLGLVPLALGHFALGDLAAARHVGEQARDVARRFGNAPAVELLTRHLDALDAASASTT